MKQLDIPERDMQLFRICNRAEHWPWKKRSFYGFKSDFLKKYGKGDGHDLQIIVKHCYTCDGTGTFTNYGYAPREQWQPCYKCNSTGIYDISRVILKRWLLNGEVFHEPLGELWMFTFDGKELVFQDTIKGRITHDPVPDAHPTFAYLQLLYKYDRDKFFEVAAAIGGSLKAKGRFKWQQSLRRCKNMLEGLARFFGVKPPEPESEDLPF